MCPLNWIFVGCLLSSIIYSEGCNVQIEMDWPTRQKICLGIARGLTEEAYTL
jgi:hypothetical protein